MRWIGWTLVAASLAASAATSAHVVHAEPRLAPPTPPAQRKPALPTYDPKDLALFARATMADRRGDLEEAERVFTDIVRSKPVANAYWNLGDVEARLEDYNEAIKAFEKYIELAETDAEKRAAARRIAELEQMPFVVSVSGEEPGGLIFIDGVKFPTPSPALIQLDDGDHVIEWIGRESYDRRTVIAQRRRIELARMGQHQRALHTGNVVIAVHGPMPKSNEWQHAGHTFVLDQRFTLPPGHYETPIYEPNRACTMLAFDVPRDGVLYVNVQAGALANGCHPITVQQQKVKP